MGRKTDQIRISISAKEAQINIGRGVIWSLENPAYIRLLRNKKENSIAVQPCDKADVMSFKVPERLLQGEDVKFRIASTPFCRDIFKDNNWDTAKTYSVPGTLLEGKRTAVFYIKDGKAG